MRQLFFTLLTCLIFSGCATTQVQVEPIATINSDIYPVELSRAQYYEEMGKAYAADQQTEKAIDYLRLSILHNPRRTSARLALSDEYKKARMEHLALFELGEILKTEPHNKEVLLKLGDLYLSTHIYSKAREAFTALLQTEDEGNSSENDQVRWSLFYIYSLEKNYIQAEKVLNQIKKTDSNQGILAYERAMLAKQFQRFKEYALLIEEAYRAEPHNRKYTLELNRHYLKTQEYDRASEILQNYSQTHDFDMEISETLSYAALRAENYDLALAELDKQKTWSDEPSVIHLKKAHIYFLMGDLDKAEKIYLITLKERPNQDEARFYLSQLYLYQGRVEEVRALLENLPVSSDYYADAQVRLAFFEKQSGEKDLAINRVRQAHSQRPEQLVIYKAYADFLIESQRYVETVALLEKGIRFFPNDEDLRVKIAFVHYRLHNQRSFKKHIVKALQINPNSADVYSTLTELWYLKNKNPRDTEYFAELALQYKSQNTNIKPLLAWALMSQDRSTEAVALFEEFYEKNPDQPFYAEALARVYSQADVTIKAQKMNQLALKLQNNNSLKSGLILDSQNKTIDASRPNASPVRLPASLENQ